jgi:hypothetical protein
MALLNGVHLEVVWMGGTRFHPQGPTTQQTSGPVELSLARLSALALRGPPVHTASGSFNRCYQRTQSIDC